MTPTTNPTPGGDVIVEIAELHKSFGAVEVLQGIDVTIRRGEVVCVIGPSGSGKSTLLRCVNLLEQPTGGTVTVAGVEVTDPDCDIDQVRSTMGIVFQQFNLFPHLTVLAQLHDRAAASSRSGARPRPRRIARGPTSSRSASPSRTDAFPAQLSGGQQQRVAIARALSMEPGADALRRADVRARPRARRRRAGGHATARRPRA